ncbi:iron complex outermembrane receptor protein [Panacagrimonas perspica]|uniref:Iron complex outermembrane receptor protein n=1 Tax=Panacagrimonas perspica TaxID=381431 RepID=A0A4S3K6I7_9GAMM|nr:TonB-dependent receptor [Panacagrimonas perspica]TDU25626.1 iron complex outermembrane receptor protein [Panacagrimonas perspica]THD03779.1 hypothetical protein B1810_07835 [Panacagrimonas perspica]
MSNIHPRHHGGSVAVFDAQRTVLGLALALPWCAQAQTLPVPPEPAVTLEEVVVEAHPLGRTAEELVRPVDVLSGEELERSRNGTIGDVLAHRPGVSNASFGPGVGRPVIRGQGTPRVQVLDNGIATMDASSISADHAVGVDPLGADRVEIIKGPATLLYGGAASAGVVNLVDDRLPDKVTPGLNLRGLTSYGSNADEKNAALRAHYGTGPLQLGAQYGTRRAGDFSVPGYAARQSEGGHVHEGEEEETPRRNVLDNSRLRSDSIGASTAYVGARGMFGVAMSDLESEYGIPSGGHHHHDHEGEEDEAGHSHDGVRIELEQTRYDLRGLLLAPMAGIEDVEARVGINDYQHREVEPSGTIGTVFDVEEIEARLQATHLPAGLWQGVLGLQYGHRDFVAVGAEAFVPRTKTESLGLFVVEDRPFGEHRLELGARVDHLKHAPEAERARNMDFTTWSLSAGISFLLVEHLHLRLNAQQAERAPSAEELYANGPHLATSSFERGSQALDPEATSSFEVAFLRDHGRLQWEVGAFYSHIADYVYLSEVDVGLDADGGGTADSDGEADRVDEDGSFDADGELLLVDQRQEDARFYGGEVSVSYAVLDRGPARLSLQAFGDVVRGERDGGRDLPRIPPLRGGVGFEASYSAFSGGVRYLRADKQDRKATLETNTPGYDLVTADFDYRFRLAGVTATLFVQGRNLLDEKVRLSTSFLKDVAPLPGRSIFTGIRFDFRPPA